LRARSPAHRPFPIGTKGAISGFHSLKEPATYTFLAPGRTISKDTRPDFGASGFAAMIFMGWAFIGSLFSGSVLIGADLSFFIVLILTCHGSELVFDLAQ